MTTENITIELTDKVAPSVSDKFIKIAQNARTANDAVEKLKTTLAALSQSSVSKLQAEMTRLNGELQRMTAIQSQLSAAQAQAATAAQRLATEQQRTAQATANAAAAQTRAQTATTQGATATQALAAATARTATAQTQGVTAAQRLSTEQQRTAAQTANAAAAADRAALAGFRLQQAQQKAAQSAANLESSLGGLVMRLATLVGGVLSLKSVIGAADEYQALANKLQIVSDSSAQVVELQSRLFEVANRTRAGVEATTAAFVRFDNALVSSGKSQEETLRLTETINKLFVIGGASAAEQASAVTQLGQAFNSGVLAGDEFKSVSENMPKVVRTAVAEVLKINESALKKAASDGKITAQVLFEAFKKLDEFADSKFAKTVSTISQGLVVLKNTFIEASGKMSESLGVVEQLVEFLNGMGNIIKQVAEAFSTLDKEQSNVSMGSSILKGLLEAVLVVLQTIIVVSSDVVFVFKMVGLEIGAIAAQLAALVRLDFSGFKAISEAVKEDGVRARKELDQFQARIMSISTNNKMDLGLGDIGKTQSNLRGRGPNTVRPPVDEKALKAAENRAAALAKVNLQLDNELQRMDLLKPARENQAKFDQIEETMAGKKIKLIQSEVSSIKEKIAAIQQGAIVQAEFDRIYEEAVAPVRNYNAAAEATGKLLAAGAITQQQAAQALGKATETYQNAIDPLRQYNIELNQQGELLKMLPKQREIEQQIMQKNNDMIQSRGIPLNEQELAQLREKLTMLQQLNAVSQQESALLSETVDKRKTFIDQLTAINNLKANQQSGFTAGDQAGATNNMLSGMGVDTSNLEVGLNAQLAVYQTYYSQLQSMLDNQLLSEQDYARARAQIASQESALKLKTTSDFFENLSGLQHSNIKELAAIGKAAAITQALINTYQGATKALAEGGLYGIATAAVVVANGMAQVANIRSQGNGYKEGGYTGNIGVNEVAGAVHGREYVMDANATSRIGVANLQALQSGAASVQQNGKQAGVAAPKQTAANDSKAGNVGTQQRAQLNARIINVVDPALVGDYLSTYEGEETVLNVMRRNKDTVQRLVSN